MEAWPALFLCPVGGSRSVLLHTEAVTRTTFTPLLMRGLESSCEERVSCFSLTRTLRSTQRYLHASRTDLAELVGEIGE